MEKLMRKEGVSGRKVKIESIDSYFILSEKHDVISTNGKHEAIQIDGKIYDNLNPNGISLKEWKHDLGIDEMPWAFKYDDTIFIK